MSSFGATGSVNELSMLGAAGSLAGVPASIQALLQSGTLQATLFPPNSRYAGIDTAVMGTSDGKTIIYLRRRFVPKPERFAVLSEHTVTAGERLDIIAARYLGAPGDPEQFWRICDANRALKPEELTERVGRVLRITLPEGIAAATSI